MDSANLSTKCQWIADLARNTILDQRVTDGVNCRRQRSSPVKNRML